LVTTNKKIFLVDLGHFTDNKQNPFKTSKKYQSKQCGGIMSQNLIDAREIYYVFVSH